MDELIAEIEEMLSRAEKVDLWSNCNCDGYSIGHEADCTRKVVGQRTVLTPADRYRIGDLLPTILAHLRPATPDEATVEQMARLHPGWLGLDDYDRQDARTHAAAVIAATASQPAPDALRQENERLREALQKIAADGPETDPGPACKPGYGWVSYGNYDDVAHDAAQEVRWQHAEIARAALGAADA